MDIESSLPYRLPSDLSAKVDYLADLMGIKNKIYLHTLPSDVAVELLSLIVLYRHLNHYEKLRVAQLLERVDRRVLNDLQTAMARPAVQPNWGMWSWTNEELIANKEALSRFNSWAGLLGLSVSASSARDMKKLSSLSARGAWRSGSNYDYGLCWNAGNH